MVREGGVHRSRAGDRTADQVVVATGWRTPDVAGVDLPVRPFRYQTLNLETEREFEDWYPVAWESVTDLYWRPEHNGDLHVGGMAIAGIPGVIVGRTGHHAWTLTSGNSDNIDVFVEIMGSDDTYLHGGSEVPFTSPGEGKVRSVHGPVIDRVSAGTIEGVDVPLAVALKFTFWEKELEMASAFYDMWKAENRSAFEQALRKIPMSFNILYANDDQQVGYWHVGLYQDRQNGVDPRFPHLGIGTQEWNGLIPFEHLPKMMDPPAGFITNWNNKPVGWWSNGDRANWVTTDTGADE